MGVKVGTLAKRVENARIVVGPEEGEVVNVEFRPGALTLGALDELQQAALQKTFNPVVFETLLKPILVSWDLLDDDGSPLPITREGLHKLPLEFIGELVSVLSSNAEVAEGEGKDSDATSQQTDDSVASLTGTSSSVQAGTSA